MPIRRALTALLTASALLLASLAVAPQPVAAAGGAYFDGINGAVYEYGKWSGGYMKDWTEGKAGYGSNWKLSDTKKYGLISGTATMMALISLSLPDPASDFRNQMLEELDGLIERLTDLVNQVSELHQTADEILTAIDDLELTAAMDTVNDVALDILNPYGGVGSTTYVGFGKEMNEDRSKLDDDEYMADFDAFMRGLGGKVAGPQQALHTAVLVFMADSYLPILTSRYETSAAAELPYYTAAVAPALYFDSASAAGGEMLADHYNYLADVDPENESWWVSRADLAIDSHRQFRSQLYELVGSPVGTDDYKVFLDVDEANPENSAWKLEGSAPDPRREWYGMGEGVTEIELTDFPMSASGRPTINSSVWHVGTVGVDVEFDDNGQVDPDADLPTIEVYRDGALVDSLDGLGLAFPGPDVDEVTLATNRDEAKAAAGWALAPIPVDGGPPFVRWSGDEEVETTTTVEVEALAWSFFTAVFDEPWSRVDTHVDGDGVIEVWEEGTLVTTLAAGADEPVTMLVGQEVTDLHLTTDPAVAADPDVLMALLASGPRFVGWSPSLGAGDHVVQVHPGEIVETDARFDLDNEVTLQIDIDGPGVVETYRDGELDGALDESGSLLVRAGDVTFTSNADDIPSEGWAVLAATGGNTFEGWGGVASGTATQVVALDALATYTLDASFSPVTTQVDVQAGANGVVEVYDRHGNRIGTVDDGSDAFHLAGDELVLTTNRDDLPTNGPALLAIGDAGFGLDSWTGAGTGRDTQVVSLPPGGIVWTTAQFAEYVSLDFDRVGSRVFWQVPEHASFDGELVAALLADGTVIDGTAIELDTGYTNGGTMERGIIEVTELYVELDGAGNVQESRLTGVSRYEDFSLFEERIRPLTRMDVDFDPGARILTVEVHSDVDREAVLKFVPAAIDGPSL